MWSKRTLGSAIITSLLALVSACTTVSTSEPGQTGPTNAVVKPQRPAKIDTRSEYDLIIKESVRIASSVRTDYDQAMRHLSSGEQTAGISLLESIVAEAPELTAPHVDLGVAYLNAGQLAEAETRLLHALVLTPGHPVAANELGVVYRRTGRFELARQSFLSALDKFPNYHIAQKNLGALCDVFLVDLNCALDNYRAYQQAYPDEREIKLWIVDVERRLVVEGEA
jgi:Flp pilus assembly protein TadD